MTSPEVIHFVVREDGTVDTHVRADGDLTRITPAGIAEKCGSAVDAVKRKLSPLPGLTDLLQQDAIEWPDGHPCRYCGRLQKDHNDLNICEGWR